MANNEQSVSGFLHEILRKIDYLHPKPLPQGDLDVLRGKMPDDPALQEMIRVVAEDAARTAYARGVKRSSTEAVVTGRGR